ncbi:MAG: UvrD-helicase domain-containing protein [Candidatus Dependentiae bacterium]|nr:UvrD-helicase domain-containing protein [Candidatus Dependentiae bacterium]
MKQHTLAHLNDQQRAAVEPAGGILLVRAGAGSGKTRVITTRIAHLIAHHQVSPQAIVALTFTNKAAIEMRERVAKLLAGSAEVPYVGTFHAYCLRLLKKNRHLLSIPDFTILDDDDQEKLVQKIMVDAGLHKQLSTGRVRTAFSQAKNNAVDGNVNLLTIDHVTIRELFQIYETEKRRAHSYDFDDLLIETIALLRKHEDFRLAHQRLIRHLLVDEYQDTNRVQHALLRTLACDQAGTYVLDSLCVVGDEDQSIYSWRGATVGNILDFARDFPGTRPITIEQNYRSVQPILEAANYIITNNSARAPKELWSTRDGHDRIRVIKAASDRHEADLIARAISTARRLNPLESSAVLYRSHYQSRTIEEALIGASIPYTIIGGLEFYARLEIKDLLAYLKLTVNPYDRVSFLRVFNTPTRGLGDRFEELFFELWDREPFFTFRDVARKLIDEELVTGAKAKSLEQFLVLFDALRPDMAPTDALQTIIRQTNYRAYLHHAFDHEVALEKESNIAELSNAINEMHERGITAISALLDEIALIQGKAEKSNAAQNRLLLMTLHAAKGLEFDLVIVPGLEEGIFPSGRSSNDSSALEEERRLLYVGITRARERLILLHAARRYTYGQLSYQSPSRFIDELPPETAPHEDATHWSSYQGADFFKEWLSGREAGGRGSVPIPNPHAENMRKKSRAWSNDPFAEKPIETPIPHKKSPWAVGQAVVHRIFGPGTIRAVEVKETGITYLTIAFEDGQKKISASFVQAVE